MIKNKSRLSFVILPILFLLVLACAFSLRMPAGEQLVASAEVTSLEGTGIHGSPKHIVTVDDFIFFMEKVNDPSAPEEYLNYCYDLETDLDLSSENLNGKTIVPIGTQERPFNGHLDGKGHVISGLSINATGNNAGLFGVVTENALIKSLGIVNASVTASGYSNVGGIVGYNSGTVENSFYHGTINASQNVGGIAGVNKGVVEYSFSNARITATGARANAGGIVGANHSTLQYSYAIGTIYANNSTPGNFGGVIGGRYTDESKSTPVGTFFNLSSNAGLGAIGYFNTEQSDDTNSSIDKSPVVLSEEKAKGVQRIEFGNSEKAVAALFGISKNWARDAFIVKNHSSYAAPLQEIFKKRLSNEPTNVTLRKNLETACSERMYGIDSNSNEEWGTQANPYRIGNETELRNLQNAVSNLGETYENKYFLQTANIALTSRFYPIGSYYKNTAFQACYDGGNKIISGLNVSETQEEVEYLGMFGYVGNVAHITSLTLDSTCTVTGHRCVGSLVGFNAGGKISNVATYASVSAQARCGGVVGLTDRGDYENILSNANLSLRGFNNGGVYGVIGGYQNNKPYSMNNVWYLVNTAKEKDLYTGTNGFGNSLLYDATYGSVVASRNENGSISFAGNVNSAYSAKGFEIIYKNADESIVCASKDYTTTTEETAGDVVYVRFVKEISSSYDISDDACIVTQPEFESGNAKFYVGQTFTLKISVAEGAYVKSVVAKNASDEIIELSNVGFSFDGNSASVEYRAIMSEALSNLEIDFENIVWDESTFREEHTYTGEAIVFPINSLAKPEDYSIIVEYSGGTAPVKANQTPSENYSFTVIYRNKDGIKMGSKNGLIHINKCQLGLNVTSTTLENTKEWNGGVDDDVPAKVDNNDVVNKKGNDEVYVNATMNFDNDNVIFNSGTGQYAQTDITYKFTLSGKDASNYIAPVDTIGQGYVTKRKVSVSLSSNVGEFSGLGKKPSLSGKNIIPSGIISALPYDVNYEFRALDGSEIEAIDNGKVGEYRLSIVPSEECAACYDISFTNAVMSEDGTYSYIIYKVVALKRDVVYSIDGNVTNSITYDGETHGVTAYFLDEENKKVNVTLDINSITDAGEHIITASYESENYDISASAIKTLVINKAMPSAMSFISSNTHDFGVPYYAQISGNHGNSEVVFSVKEECGDMGSFEGNKLTIRKAGEIKIVATQLESANYLENSVELTLTVNKTEMEISVSSFAVDYLDEITFVYVDENGVELTGVEGVSVFLDGKEYVGGVLPVKDYQISIIVSDEAVSDGYDISAGQCGILTVNKLKIIVTADNKESVYGEKLKELTYQINDARVTSLEGALTTTARNVGESDVEIGTLESMNPNYEIEFNKGTYTITPKTITVKAQAKEKYYGDADPVPSYEVEGLAYDDSAESIGLNINITRFSGEDSVLVGSSEYATYNYRVQGSITTTSANYVAVFETAKLTILPKEPEITSKEAVRIMAGSKLDESNKPAIKVSGKVYDGGVWTMTELAGSSAWEKSVTPNFKDSATLIYKVIFTPEDKNFTAKEIEIEVTVIPVEVTVRFISSKQIVYDGYEHDDVEYELVGLIAGEDADEKITYVGDVKNVGSFVAKVTLNNYNYKLAGGGEATIKITEADLEVSVNDMVILEGETPKIEYLYFGFQKGDSNENLEKEPSVIFPVKPGTYTLTPSGARSDNYKISYKSFTFKVLTKNVADEENGITLEGRFDSQTQFEMVEGQASVEINDLYAQVKESYKALENMGINAVYDLKYTIGDQSIVVSDEVYLTMPVVKVEGDTKLAYAILTNDGEIVYVQDVLYDGDVVTLNVTNAKALLILTEQEDNSMMLYLAIGAVVVVIILIVAIARSVKKRREARYIKYEE